MPVRSAVAVWRGSVCEGAGTVKLGSGAFGGQYSYPSRFEQGAGTKPEELIAAAHAGCFSMALSSGLGRAGFTPKSIRTVAQVHIERIADAWRITRIELDTEGDVPGIEEKAFLEQAESAKGRCPVSVALASVEIVLRARLVKG